MRLVLVCVGRPKRGPEREIFDRYLKLGAACGRTLGFPAIELCDVAESRAGSAQERKREEARSIGARLPADCKVIALDEHGKQMTSRGFASLLADARDSSASHAALIIGGPDGLDPVFLSLATVTLSLGLLTWPHRLAQIAVAEQIYRAMTILSGHPYHRD
ncbi:MAG TPA: 23S rRNA (pseudouridine(1915)-N(3))-methyltransferase RlmH [Methylocella sp.]|nr:23S rRNA (pseudouridine(1915)-N(3))-methyltransferase RlmH [Methylocella sp.]